jgi:hypothetical protein
MKFIFWSFISMPGIIFLTYIYALLSKKLLAIICITLSILLFIIFFILFNNNAKKIVKKVYGINPNKWIWNSKYVTSRIFEADKKGIKTYFKSEKLTSKMKEYLLNQCIEEVKRLKPKFPVLPSFVAAIILSLINNFMSWIFKQPDSLHDALWIFITISSILLILLGMLLIVKVLIKQIVVGIFYRDYYEMARFRQNNRRNCIRRTKMIEE